MDLTQHPLDRKFQAWAARYHRFAREPLTMGSVWSYWPAGAITPE